MKIAGILLSTLVMVSTASAQTRDRASVAPTTSPDLSTLATGWGALAAGRAAEAIKAADTVLARRPGDHHATELKIEALSVTEPLRALDVYDAWLTKSGIEDLFLVVPIARGTLEQIAKGPDRALRGEALRRLGRGASAAGDAEPAQDASGLSPVTRDIQAALAGEPSAAKRLLTPAASSNVPPQTLAKALVAAGPAAVPTLRALLKHSAAPVRMEAALALGKMSATDAIPDLKALLNDPEVHSFAAVALTRLGDGAAENIVEQLLQSPVFEVRLLAAQAYEGREAGPWVQALMPALQDPNGLTRIRAAELLAPVAPEAARAVLLEAANDPNPVVRGDVSRVMEKTGLLTPTVQQSDPLQRPNERLSLASLRRLLRDADPAVRLHAAGTILDFAHVGK